MSLCDETCFSCVRLTTRRRPVPFCLEPFCLTTTRSMIAAPDQSCQPLKTLLSFCGEVRTKIQLPFKTQSLSGFWMVGCYFCDLTRVCLMLKGARHSVLPECRDHPNGQFSPKVANPHYFIKLCAN